jgi:hypothetical protein
MLLLLLLLRVIVMMAPTARIIHIDIFILMYSYFLCSVGAGVGLVEGGLWSEAHSCR